MDNSTISMDELNNLSKETLIFLFAQQSESLRILTEQNAAITKQNETLSRQITDLNEKLAILIQQRFGSKTEKQLSGQCSFLVSDTGELVFNEIEAAVPDEYLKEYKGILVTDGYESYHTLARRRPDDLKVAGCWAHLKRRFAEIVKAIKKNEAVSPTQQLAVEAVKKIELIYHTDNKFKDSAYEERLNNRQKAVKPLVDAYFAWVKDKYQPGKIDSSSKLAEAFKYSLKQESYLRVFLDDAKLPLDNNDAERSIKKFCVGKKNWQIIDSKHGAEASAMLYSLAETVKANGLKTYNYFVYLLDQLKEYPRGEVPEDVLEALMPWSDKLPEDCRKTKSR